MTEAVAFSTTPVLSRSERAARAAHRTVSLLLERQTDDHWPSDYGGPLFLLPGLLIAHAITGVEIDPVKKQRMLTYLHNVQNRDGGFGLHVEGPSTVLGTALNYVALRLLGEAKDAPAAARCRARLLELGGAEGIPTWGKFWLAVLGVYRWEGINPLPPELWLLPRSLPVHPANMWCHTRAVFLPMSYLYGRRFSADLPIARELRNEMFTTPWDRIDWPSLRERIAPGDVYTPHSIYLKAFNRLCAQYERRPSRRLRKIALEHAIDLIHHEDETTGYLTIGPVSKAIHMLAVWVEDPQSAAFQKHLARVGDYLWDGHDGMKMQGYNGSQLWDVAFTMRALLELRRTHPAPKLDEVLQAAHRFLDRNQVRENIDRGERYHRDPIAGGWPFSTAEQGWTVSDCTAEGLKVAVEMQSIAERPIPHDRLEKAIDLILFSQNDDGGWSEYERARGGASLERMNAAEVFGDIMIGYSYTECTSACIQSMKAFSERWPHYRRAEIETAIERGARFIESRQRPDGGFYGGWGVCFTYGTWFAIEGLLAAGRSPECSAIRRAARFLLDHQRADGSFAESFESCVEHRWIHGKEGNVVQTSWALLALMALPQDSERRRAIDRGIDFLLTKQREDGGWDRPGTTGVFNRNCAINYDNYRFYFPLWALARYLKLS